MDEPKLLRDAAGREVVKFTTPSGVVAIVDASVSQEAIASFARSLKRRMARRAAQQRRSTGSR